MDIAVIIGIISAIGSVSAILISIFKQPHELKNVDADTVKKYAEAASLSADRPQNVVEEFDSYRKLSEERINALQAKVTELEKYKNENEILRDWAERLVHQVQSLGGSPVPMKITNSKKGV